MPSPPHCALCWRQLKSDVSWRPLNVHLEASLRDQFSVHDFKSGRVCNTCRLHGPPAASAIGLPRSSKQSKRASNYRRNTLATLIAAVATTEGQSPDDLLETMISSHIGESLFPVLREALQHRHEDSVLAANALRLMSELPSYSHLRRPLLSYLAEGLNPSRAAQLFGVSPSAVRHALKEGFEPDTTDLFSQYPTGVARQKLNKLEEECIVELIKTICPVKSGSKYEKYVQRLTNEQLYEQYRQFAAPLIAELVRKLERQQNDQLSADEAKTVPQKLDKVLHENIEKFKRKTLLESDAMRKRQKTCSEADRYHDLERFRTLDDVAKFISSRVSNCTVIKLTVDRDPALKPAVRRLPMGIQKFHSFRYASRELVKTAVRSDVDEFVNQPITFITGKDEKVEDDDSDSDDEDEKMQHSQQRRGRKQTRERDDDDVDMTAMCATADAMVGLSQSQSSTTSSSSSSVEAPPAAQPRRNTRKRTASAAAIASHASQLDQQGL